MFYSVEHFEEKSTLFAVLLINRGHTQTDADRRFAMIFLPEGHSFWHSPVSVGGLFI